MSLRRGLLTILLASAVAGSGATLGPSAARAASDSALALVARANAAYEAEDYEAAIETFGAVLDTGLESALVHYNLGNAKFKAGRLGPAIWHYRRAHQLAPRDEDVQANLEYARFLVIDSYEEGARTDLRVEGWIDRITATEAARVAAILFALAAVAAIVGQLAPAGRHVARRWLVTLLVLWGVTLAVSIAAARHTDRLDEAVLLPREVEVRNGPGGSFDVAFVLHEGAEVVVEGERGRWTEISLPGDLRGWLESDLIARL